MLGAIIGDMVGSIYEFDPIKTKEFDIYDKEMHITDDSLATLCIAKILRHHYPFKFTVEETKSIQKELTIELSRCVYNYPYAGWGNRFLHWAENGIYNGSFKPYNSCGNGAGMRISSVGWIANSIEEVKTLSRIVTEITHNHREGIKGAESIAMCVYLARNGRTKEEIRKYVIDNYYPEIDVFDFDDLVKNYTFEATCQKSCPQAIYCFLISNDLESAIRNCVAIGGDCDTTGAMAGAIAEAFYNKDTFSKLEDEYLKIIDPNIIMSVKMFFDLIGNKKYSKIK